MTKILAFFINFIMFSFSCLATFSLKVILNFTENFLIFFYAYFCRQNHEDIIHRLLQCHQNGCTSGTVYSNLWNCTIWN